MTEIVRHPAVETYEVAHHVLTSPPVPGQELRGAPRHPFKVLQWIAPYHGSGLPDKSRFFQVRCRDLSQSGFSFFAPERPDFPTLVVSLGEPPNQTHLVAEIVRCDEVRLFGGGYVEMVDDAEGDGDTNDQGGQTFLVGCRFKGRVQ
jgi:hypothetical protein